MIQLPERLSGERLELLRHRLERSAAAAEAIEESLDALRPWQPWVEKFTGIESCIAYSEWVARQWGARFDYQIMRLSDGRFLGQANLEPFEDGWQVGFWLRSSVTGKGYCSEAVALLIEAALEQPGQDRVALVCDASNVKSANVARRLGMSLEAENGGRQIWIAQKPRTG